MFREREVDTFVFVRGETPTSLAISEKAATNYVRHVSPHRMLGLFNFFGSEPDHCIAWPFHYLTLKGKA